MDIIEQIKYRAKDQRGSWVHGLDFPKYIEVNGLKLIDFFMGLEMGTLNPATLCRWTGYIVKQGGKSVDVYEKDKVEYCYFYPAGTVEFKKEIEGVVTFDEGAWRIRSEDELVSLDWAVQLQIRDSGDFRITGTIFDKEKLP